MRRVAFATLGCKANQFDTFAAQDGLSDEASIVDFKDQADVYVINTCTVTHRADSDARQLIRRAKRNNPDARVIVTGCYAQTQPEAVAAVDGVDLVIGNSHKDQLVHHILADQGGESLKPADPTPQVLLEPLEFKRAIPELPEIGVQDSRTRSFVKIQDGCDYSCTFCIITIARGANTSLPLQAVLMQVQALDQAGVQEIVLTGVQIGRYGRDLKPRITLTEAIQAILDTTDIPRIRLSSIDPREFDASLVDLIVSEPRICPHMHIPIQSGDDAILMLMRRDHDRAFMRELFEEFHYRRPEILFGSDVIVGFPGEGPSEFDMTVDFVEQWIDHPHVFSYSDRPGTHAAQLQDKVPSQVIARRSKVLRELGEKKRNVFARGLAGSEQQLLVESTQRAGQYLAYTPHYIPVQVPATLANAGELIDAEVAWQSQGLVAVAL